MRTGGCPLSPARKAQKDNADLKQRVEQLQQEVEALRQEVRGMGKGLIYLMELTGMIDTTPPPEEVLEWARQIVSEGRHLQPSHPHPRGEPGTEAGTMEEENLL